MPNNYDPNVMILRQMLALSILGRLEEAGFQEEPLKEKLARPELAEKVFSRVVGSPKNGMKIMVYSTVVGDGEAVPFVVRQAGKDAIRISGVYVTKDGKTRGISSARRVNRTGDINDIVERMVERMRAAWRSCYDINRCDACGAPKFNAKSGKSVCAEICWLTPEQKMKNAATYTKNETGWASPVYRTFQSIR